MHYKEKSQYDEFQRITTMAQHGGIPKIIIDDASRLHKKISEQQVAFSILVDGKIEKDGQQFKIAYGQRLREKQ